MANKKTKTKEKIEPKVVKNLQLEFKKETLKSKKDYLKQMIDVLVKYGFKEVATSAIFFDDLWRKEIKINFDLIEKSTLPTKEKEHLKRYVFPVFGNPDEIEERKNSKLSDEEWTIQKDTEYTDRLISTAENSLNGLSTPIKEKIVRDSIVKKDMWIQQMIPYHKITQAIEAQNKDGKKE